MQIRIAAPTAALAALASIGKRSELNGFTVDGPFLTLDLHADLTFENALLFMDQADVYVGGLVADADDVEQASALSALKSSIVVMRGDVVREFTYNDSRTEPTTEATNDQTGSHPTSTGVASTSLSSQQHGVASEQKEEISNEQEQQAQPSRKQRSGR